MHKLLRSTWPGGRLPVASLRKPNASVPSQMRGAVASMPEEAMEAAGKEEMKAMEAADWESRAY